MPSLKRGKRGIWVENFSLARKQQQRNQPASSMEVNTHTMHVKLFCWCKYHWDWEYYSYQTWCPKIGPRVYMVPIKIYDVWMEFCTILSLSSFIDIYLTSNTRVPWSIRAACCDINQDTIIHVVTCTHSVRRPCSQVVIWNVFLSRIFALHRKSSNWQNLQERWVWKFHLRLQPLPRVPVLCCSLFKRGNSLSLAGIKTKCLGKSCLPGPDFKCVPISAVLGKKL